MKGTEKNIRSNKKDKSIEPSQFFLGCGLVLASFRLQASSVSSRLFFKGESIVNYFEIVCFSFSSRNFFFVI